MEAVAAGGGSWNGMALVARGLVSFSVGKRAEGLNQ